jgi:hypothetical protein
MHALVLTSLTLNTCSLLKILSDVALQSRVCDGAMKGLLAESTNVPTPASGPPQQTT